MLGGSGHARRAIRACILLAISCISWASLWAQDSISIHFLYGSKPRHAFAATEPRWFGGKAGGHVGIAFAPDSILNFLPMGKFHWIGQRDPKHSHYVVSDTARFEKILGESAGPLKTVRIRIPLDSNQMSRFQAIQQGYLAQTPYDYAFLGMRCASATDEVLAKLGITHRRGYWGTIFGTFHPKVLRKRLLRMARRADWPIVYTAGSNMRKWQR